jgi:hypothetical protein
LLRADRRPWARNFRAVEGRWWRTIICMSIVQACADAEAQVACIRSLFGDGAASPGEVADLTSAVQTAGTAREAITPLSGGGVDGYQSVVESSLRSLTTGAGSDTTLAEHLGAAAAAAPDRRDPHRSHRRPGPGDRARRAYGQVRSASTGRAHRATFPTVAGLTGGPGRPAASLGYRRRGP